MALSAKIGKAERNLTVVTEDVSYRGVFLRTDSSFAIADLLGVDLWLPPDSFAVSVQATVRRAVAVGAQTTRAPGIGVEFSLVDQAFLHRWHQFINHIKRAQEFRDPLLGTPTGAVHPKRSRSVFVDPTTAIDAVRRRYPRHTVHFALKIENLSTLYTFYANDISQGGMFIATDAPLEPGTPITIVVLHPDDEVRTFTLQAVVRRCTEHPPGLGVEFTGLDDATRKAFFEFIPSTGSR